MSLTEAISFFVGIIGTAISIYQWAQINANKERLREIQFLFASIHSTALMKQLAWQNQLSFHANPPDEKSKEMFRIHVRAKDDFADLSTFVSAMEGAISANDSAIAEVMKRAIHQNELNNTLQAVALKNPSLPQQ